MAVYAKGKGFMASWGSGPERARKTFKTEEAANVWLAEMESKEAPSVAPVGTSVPATCWTLREAYDQVHRHVWKGTAAESKAAQNCNQAMDFFGADTFTSEIGANWIIEWMEELQDERGNSGATCNKKLSSLSMLLKRAEQFGGLTAVPRMKRYRESQHRIRWFTDVEEKDMLDMCDHLGMPELRDFIVIGIDTGFRKSELMRLTLSDYHKGSLILHAGETKNEAPRTVPCTPRVTEVINKRIASGQRKVFPTLTMSTLRKQWEDLRSHLNKEDDAGFIIHIMRHTCATRLVSENVPLVTVQAWMGHKVIQTTMRYAHLAKGQLDSALTLLTHRKRDLADA